MQATSLSRLSCGQVESGLSTRCTVAWQPEQGQLLAAPGRTGVVLYERLSWTAVATLAEGTEIQTVCFSPDGTGLGMNTHISESHTGLL